MRHTLKTVLFSLAVIAVCSSLQFAGCVKNQEQEQKQKHEAQVKEELGVIFQNLKDFYKAMDGDHWDHPWDTANADPNKANAETDNGFIGVTIVINPVGITPAVFVQKIDLWHQNLTGTLATNILLKFKDIEEISLDENRLTGNVPVELSALQKLTFLQLSNNRLTGIPPEIGQFKTLKTLFVDFNQLTGNIPVEIGQLTELSKLSLAHNQLTGNIPVELSKLTLLEFCHLSFNNLVGGTPQAIKNMANYPNFEFCPQLYYAQGLPCPFEK